MLVESMYSGHWTTDIARTRMFDFAGLGAVLIVGLCLGFEAVCLGWDACSLNRLLTRPGPSEKTDSFYALLFISGLTPVLGFLLSCGVRISAHGERGDRSIVNAGIGAW